MRPGKCIVTGANGFIGSRLCKRLLDNGFEATALVRRTSNLRLIEGLNLRLEYGDLSDVLSLRSAVQGMEYIFHVGGLTKTGKNEDFFRVNHRGTVNLLDAVAGAGGELKRFIYVSSQAAAGPGNDFEPVDESRPPAPVTTYGRSKLEGENEVMGRSDQLPVTIIRPTSVYGPGDTEILSFFKAAGMGIRPYFGDGKAVISLAYVDDLVTGIIQSALSDKAVGNIYFLSDGDIYQWDDIVQTLMKTLGRKGAKFFIPVGLFLFAGSVNEQFGRAMGKRPMFTREKAYEITRKNWACSCQKAIQDFDYSPEIKFPEGARITAKWYKDNGWL